MPTEPIPTDADSERDRKRRSLLALFATTPRGDEAAANMNAYLHSSRDIPANEYAAACEVLQDTWTDSYRSPQPGHVREAAHGFSRKGRAEIVYEQGLQRTAAYKRNRMDPDKICAELANPQFVDPDPALEAKRIAGLKRILEGMEGQEVKRAAVKVRQRGDGGLERAAFGDVI